MTDEKQVVLLTYQEARETISDISKPYAIKTKEVLDDTAKALNKNEQPAEFRLVDDGYKLVTENPLVLKEQLFVCYGEAL